MRFFRVMAVAALLAAIGSHSSAAQEGRTFKDAWFWGVKTGALSYSSASTQTGGAPLVGAEWLITRTSGGLYVSFDQAFLNTTGAFVDQDTVRAVGLQNMRRFTLAAMAFPGQTIRLHPYVGFGMTVNAIGSTTLLTATSAARFNIAQDSITSRKTVFAPIVLAGFQYRLRPFSVFVQGGAFPAQQRFFLSNSTSRPFDVSIEAGVRYNVGTSIEGIR